MIGFCYCIVGVTVHEMLTSDLLGGNEFDKFCELTWSSAVNTKHTLLVCGNDVKLQRNFVLGVSTDHQHATLQTPIICHTHTMEPTDCCLLEHLINLHLHYITIPYHTSLSICLNGAVYSANVSRSN